MTTDQRGGRPRASSRETIAEAACELFLERGYAATSIVDITARAGVSRSSFFNYYSAKSDVLWAALDERIDAFRARGASGDLHGDLAAIGADFAPDSLALAIVHTDAMDLADELMVAASVRRSRIADAVTARLVTTGVDPLAAAVAGAAHAGAVLAAIESWARAGAGRAPLSVSLARALDVAARTLG